MKTVIYLYLKENILIINVEITGRFVVRNLENNLNYIDFFSIQIIMI